jgi:hypothetical protein
MQCHPVKQMLELREASGRVFKSNSAHQAMNLVAQFQKVLGEVTAVLSRNPGDECFLHRPPPFDQRVKISLESEAFLNIVSFAMCGDDFEKMLLQAVNAEVHSPLLPHASGSPFSHLPRQCRIT